MLRSLLAVYDAVAPEGDAMRIYVIRHGDKEKGDFRDPRFGHNDQPLSAEGRAQAVRLASFLADKEIVHVRVSEYIRTTQTIAPFCAASGLVPVLDPRLNEIDSGLVDGLDEAEVAARFPEFWAKYRELKEDFTYPGGESGADVLARIRAVMEDSLASPGNKVLLTHEGWSRLAVCHVLGLPGEGRFNLVMDTCGIMELETAGPDGRLKIRRFNYTLA